jgi:chorismate dehydratase
LKEKIKIGAVSYLNTKPLLYGLERSSIKEDIILSTAYPAQLAAALKEQTIDLALLPVAAISSIPHAQIIGNYGIAADGDVASVALFSHVPLAAITHIYLDYQSRSSVRLTQELVSAHWKIAPEFIAADTQYIASIQGTKAGVIIGDRALQQLPNFPYVYDLSAAWKAFTGLPFVFAAWVSNRSLPASFVEAFDEANAMGLQHLEEIVAAHPFPEYDLLHYYQKNIHYELDENKRKGLDLFLKMISADHG